MISFLQLCEHLTSQKRYSWFVFEPLLWDALTTEEQSLVYKQELEDGYMRLWYPKEKFRGVDKVKVTTMKKNPYRDEMLFAALTGDFEEIKRIQQLMKEKG